MLFDELERAKNYAGPKGPGIHRVEQILLLCLGGPLQVYDMVPKFTILHGCAKRIPGVQTHEIGNCSGTRASQVSKFGPVFLTMEMI